MKRERSAKELAEEESKSNGGSQRAHHAHIAAINSTFWLSLFELWGPAEAR